MAHLQAGITDVDVLVGCHLITFGSFFPFFSLWRTFFSICNLRSWPLGCGSPGLLTRNLFKYTINNGLEICMKSPTGTMCDICVGSEWGGSWVLTYFRGNHEHAIMPVTTTIKSTRGARPKHWPKWQNAANNVAGWEYYNICSIPISYIYHTMPYMCV